MNRTFRTKMWTSAIPVAALAILAGGANAQIVDNKVPLNWNFHGMVHSTEWGSETAAPWNNADAPANLFRAIADRGLYFDPFDLHAIGSYPLIGATGINYGMFAEVGYANTTAADANTNGLDIVHLGARGVYHFPFELGIRPASAAAQSPAWAPNLNITSLSGDGTNVTATTDAPHGLVVGDVINIIGASAAGYNGRQTIASVPTATSFTYANATTGATTGSIFCNNTRLFITALSGDGTTVTGTTNVPHGINLVTTPGATVIIQGSSIPEYNGTWTLATATGSTFTFAGSATGSPTGTAIIAGTCDNTTDQVTTLSSPITVDANTEIGVLYMVSNGGGAQSQFDCILTFNNGVSNTNVPVRLSANDWFGNTADPTIVSPPIVISQKKITHTDAGTTFTTFRAAANEDNASLQAFSAINAGPNLNVIEAVISVPAIIAAGTNVVGQQLTKVTFADPSWPYDATTTVAASAVVGNGTTVTVTLTGTNSNTSYAVGQLIEVRGLSPAGLNGVYPVSALVGTTQIQYLNPTVAATTTAQAYVQTPTMTITPTTGTVAGGIVTLTTSAPHGMSVGDYVRLSGFSTVGQNGKFRVLSVPSPTQFTYVGLSSSTVGQRQVARIGVNRGYSIYAVTARTGQAANAVCGGAQIVAEGTVAANNSRTLNASPASTCGGGNDTTSLWYYFTATGSSPHLVEARTCSDTGPQPQVTGVSGVRMSGPAAGATIILPLDTSLEVFTGACGALTSVACNDNGCNVSSRVQWTATPGTGYFIRVAGKNNAMGDFSLTIDESVSTDIAMPLQFNWNGINHGTTTDGSISEQNVTTPVAHDNRSDMNGYRGISDRGLLFDPNNATTNAFNYGGTVGYKGMVYQVYNTALQADMVHLGQRGQVFSPPGTVWATPATANPSSGLHPLWLANPYDHTLCTSSMTGLNATFGENTMIGVLYHMTNIPTVTPLVPGRYDVRLTFADSSFVDVTVQATDWFGGQSANPFNQALPVAALGSGVESQRVLGIYNAVQNFDRGDTAPTGQLKVLEAVISTNSLRNMSVPFDPVGRGILTSIEFRNLFSTDAGSNVGIYAATLRDPASFNLNFPPSGAGTVTPNNLVAGSGGRMTVAVSRGSGSPNNITSVVVDASAIGLSSTLALNDSGTGGDVSGNDNVWSTNVAFPVNAALQAYSLPFTVTDAQVRTAMGNIIFTVVAPSGVATPSPAIAGSSPIVTVTMSNNGVATPGVSSISVDASALGAGSIMLLDNGQVANGDAAANNGVYSGKLSIPISAAAADYQLPFTVTDTSSNIYNGMISLSVTDPTAALSVASVVVGSEPRLSLTLSNNATSTPNISSVTVDASALGLSSTLGLNDTGTGGDLTASDGIYSTNMRVPLGTPAAVYTLPYAITDVSSQVRNGTFANLTVNLPVVAPVPNAAIPTGTSKLTVTLNRGGLLSTLITTVAADLSAIGLSNAVALNDGGSDGDVTAADGVYSIDFTVPMGQAQGTFPLNWTANDSVAGAATGSVNFTVIGPPTGINLGTFTNCGISDSSTLAATQVVWYTFTLTGSGIDRALGTYLDIDTEGSLLVTTNDTELTLYDAAGNLIANDDDDGSGNLSQLSFGADVPARGAINGSLAYNGRDGATLAAGTYYLAVSGFSTTPNPLWQALSTSAYTGPYTLRIASGNINGATSGAPASYIDLGTLNTTDSRTNTGGVVPVGGIQWYRFALNNPINAANPDRTYLDIDTNGSALANTAMTLFRDDGTGALVAVDDDSGTDAHAQFSFGKGTRAASGNGLPYNGQNGTTLAAGTYYLAVTDGASSAGSNFTFFCIGGTQTGAVRLSMRAGIQSRVIAGPIVNPTNNHRYFLLESGFSWTNNEAYAVSSLNGHLASINDPEENEWVRVNVLRWPDGNTDRRGFIGFYDPTLTNSPGNTAGLFTWVNGDPAGFTAWSAGEPNNGLSGTEHYTEMLSANGLWNDVIDAGVTAGNFAVVETGCPGDFNGSGSVTIDDLFLFLNAYFLGLPSADMNNSNGTVTIDDLFLYINYYFTC